MRTAPANGNTTFTDVTGHGYNGTFTGNGDLTLGFSTDAKQGTYAGSTDGDAGRFAQVSSAQTFDFTAQFTVFTFLKMVDRGSQIQSIIGNAGGFPEDGFKLFINSYNTDDHTLIFEYEGVKVTTAPTNLLDGNYHALAFSVDQTNKLLKIYLDGAVLINNAPLTTPFPTANPIINLGTDGYFTSTSKFDDFRIYQGILTDAQVLTLRRPLVRASRPDEPCGQSAQRGRVSDLDGRGGRDQLHGQAQRGPEPPEVFTTIGTTTGNHLFGHGPDERRDLLLRRGRA